MMIVYYVHLHMQENRKTIYDYYYLFFGLVNVFIWEDFVFMKQWPVKAELHVDLWNTNNGW